MPAQRGQSYISIIIAMAIILILSNAIFSLVTASYELISFTRSRVTAKHLAQERIELIRNLTYEDVGTEGGIPSGPLSQTEDVQRNGQNYLIKTAVVYVDDPYDGTAPDDILPTDYKRVRVDVSWGGIANSERNPVTLVTDIAPQGVETSEGGGTLSILVFDSQGNPVPQANVTIFSSKVSPEINLTQQTNDQGRLVFPGAPECTSSCYEITVTKDGFSSEKTYSTDEIANPDKPHQNVLESQITEISFAIDHTATLVINTYGDKDNDYPVIGNLPLEIRLNKTIGTTELDEPVYKYNEILSTDGSGFLELTDMEWGTYQIDPNLTDTWDLTGSNPYQPFLLSPTENKNILLSFTPHTNNSVRFLFLNEASEPIASVSAVLKRQDLEATESSSTQEYADFGQVFFSDLENAVYELTATASGFANWVSNIQISGTQKETINLVTQ